MRLRPKFRTFGFIAAVWLVYLSPLQPSVGLAEVGSEAERLGYEQWLHSLEKSINGRTKANRTENYPLFPFGTPGVETSVDVPFRQLTISRALNEMEVAFSQASVWCSRGAFGAIAMARNYRNLTEYEQALRWYERAADLDSHGTYTAEVSQEALATAIALEDSLLITHNLINTLGASDPTSREEEIVLSFRYLLVHQEVKNLGLLIQKVSGLEHSMSARVRFWLAYALAQQQNRDAALAELCKLVGSGSLSHGLSEQQRAWVLTALPDLLVMQERYAEAGDLYEQLAASELEPLRSWGIFQLGSLNLLSGHYLRAQTAFSRLCENPTPSYWQKQACDLAVMAEKLGQVKAEAEPYGAAAHYE